MENKTFSIEYCTGWGYVPKAMEVAEYLLRKYKNEIKELSIIPSSDGVFEVKLGEKMVFSKKEMKRFPEIEDIEKALYELDK